MVIAEAGHRASTLRDRSIFSSSKMPVDFDLSDSPPTTRDLFINKDFAILA